MPVALLREAQERLASSCVDSAVQCQLPLHDDGEHYGFLDDLDEYGTALWLRWLGRTEAELVALPDCPMAAPGPDGEGCCLFVGHAEHHTWEEATEASST
ncbi:hypothetical protein QC282_18320 [Streptomyces sp. DH24]|nr:hypothetical protein [Streptomyces sp. DH24]MDG9718536.1 hypothetical protein [Streptomyces sp. DH24]